MNLRTKKIITIATGIALATGITVPVFAQINSDQTPNQSTQRGDWRGRGMQQSDGSNRPVMQPGVGGIVTAINGTTITLAGHQGWGSQVATTTYTVDASNATIRKNNATSTISSIVVNDRIFVEGTISGTSVTAKAIIDGFGGPMNGRDRAGRPGMASSTPPFVGNGQPVIAGSVTAINGNSLTITTASNIAYTVDASQAKVVKGQNTVSLSNVTVGERVVVQGSVSGTSVTATTIIDQATPASATPGSNLGQDRGQGEGFFGGIGNFFKHLFGF